MYQIKVIRTTRTPLGVDWEVLMDVDTWNYVMELNDKLQNRLLTHEQVREEWRALGVPSTFQWASPTGAEQFVYGDRLVVRLVTPLGRVHSAPGAATRYMQ